MTDANTRAREVWQVADLEPPHSGPNGERYAVLRIDPAQRVGDGCQAIVVSFHHGRDAAEVAQRDLRNRQAIITAVMPVIMDGRRNNIAAIDTAACAVAAMLAFATPAQVDREAVARLIEPSAWRAYDATLRPFLEDRGAHEGESWHVRAYQAGCRSSEDARLWWLKTADSMEPVTVQLFRESLAKADRILALLDPHP